MPNHTLHFHTRHLAEEAKQALLTLNIVEEAHHSSTPRSLDFQTENELDTATIALILEKLRPLSWHFNEEPDQSEESGYASAKIRIWHTEPKTQDITEYYVIIANDGKTASLIITYDAVKNEVKADVYTPPDIDYTIHDGCDHENGWCFEDQPDSSEYQEMWMSDHYHLALKQLQDLAAQVKQAKIADELRADNAAMQKRREHDA